MLNDFSINNKKLQIAIPIHCENWDIKNYTPLVAFKPFNYHENQETITAFDSNGKKHVLDVKVDPEKPVIVIGLNERSDEDGNIIINENIQLKHDFIPAPDEGEDPVTCDRDNNSQKDYLNKARFNSKDHWRLVEGWPDGRPEMKVVITFVEKVGSSYTPQTVTKILSKGDWLYRYVLYNELKTKQIDIEILSWDKDLHNESMKYTWFEMDTGGSIEKYTSTIGYKDETGNTVQTSIQIDTDSNDMLAGESLVQYCDNTEGEGYEYNTGILKFWINQQ